MEQRSVVYRVGIGGWEHEVLDQCLYPRPHMHSLDKLSYYAQFFDTVELRQTFWDDELDSADAGQWVNAVATNRRFVFNVKLHASFTHKREIRTEPATRVRGLLQELAKGDRLGALLAQFPFSFTNTSANRYHLTKIREVFRGFPVHVELRHASWDQPSLPAFLKDHGLHAVSADIPRIRQYMPFITGDVGETGYIRLHGRNEKGWLLNGMETRYDYLYNGKEIHEVHRRVNGFSARCKQITIIFNNTTDGKAVANALQLTAALCETKALPIPASALRSFPCLYDISGSPEPGLPLLDGADWRKAV